MKSEIEANKFRDYLQGRSQKKIWLTQCPWLNIILFLHVHCRYLGCLWWLHLNETKKKKKKDWGKCLGLRITGYSPDLRVAAISLIVSILTIRLISNSNYSTWTSCFCPLSYTGFQFSSNNLNALSKEPSWVTKTLLMSINGCKRFLTPVKTFRVQINEGWIILLKSTAKYGFKKWSPTTITTPPSRRSTT